MKTKNELIKLREKYLSPSLSLSYDVPLHITKGRGQYLFDQKGKKYLDSMGGLWYKAAGYGRKEIADAVYNQMTQIESSPSGSATISQIELAGKKSISKY